MRLVLVAVALVAAAYAIGSLPRLRPPIRLLLGVYAFVLPFGSAVSLPGGPSGFNTLSSLAGALVCGGLLLHVPLRQGRAPAPPSASLPWLLLVGWAGLTTLWSPSFEVSSRAFLVLFSLIALYTLAIHAPIQARDVRWLEAGVVAGATLHAARGVYLGLTGQLQQVNGMLPRFSTEGGDPNITAATFLLPLFLALWWSGHATTSARRVAALAAATVLIAAVVLTGSRGGLVAVAVTLPLLLQQADRAARWRLTTATVVLALASAAAFVVGPPGLQEHLSRTGSTGRTDIWVVGLTACEDGCWVGHGWGSFGLIYRETWLGDLAVTGNGDKTWAPHNILLGVLVEAGLVGVVLLVLGFSLLVRELLRLPRPVRGAPLCALASLLASNVFLSNVGFKYFWLTLLYVTAVVIVDRRQDDPPPPVPAAVPVQRSSSQQPPP